MTEGSLRGRTVVVTRPEPVDGPLARALLARGARPVARPVMGIRTSGSSALGAALQRLAETDWLVLTSARAVTALDAVGAFTAPPPPRLRVAVVGPRTGAAVREAGWPVHLEPAPASATALLLALEARGVGRGTRVLFPASARARPLLADGLSARGVEVEEIAVYEPVPVELTPAAWDRAGAAAGWDALTFSSPSAVEALTNGLPGATLAPLRGLPAGVQGPTTGDAARDAGWRTVIEAHPHTFDGVAEALANHLGPAEADDV